MRINRRLLWAVATVVVCGMAAAGYWWWSRPEPMPPTRIFEGISYECQRLADGDEATGLVHVVRVDLTAPRIEVFVTPLDPEAVASGYQYRLTTVGAVARQQQLAVAINGTLFSSESGLLPLPGDWATSVDTVVADGVVSHVYPYNYLLWFDAELTPHVERSRPPSDGVLREARFALGSQVPVLLDGKITSGAGLWPPSNRMMAVGVNTEQKTIWLAAFEHANGIGVAKALAARGAQDAVLLDNGDSTTLYISGRADAGPRGHILGGYRPVPTFLGIRARSVR